MAGNPQELLYDDLPTGPTLLYFDMGHLLVFNCGQDVWTRVPLDFPPLEGRRLINFVATDGGLLCLITDRCEFFVCNPLTPQPQCRRLPNPPLRLFEDPILAPRNEHQNERSHFLVEMVVRSNTDWLKLVVITVLQNVRRTFVFDSRDNGWREVGDMVQDLVGATFPMDFVFQGLRAKCKGALYMIYDHLVSPDRYHVLAYNLYQERWRSIEFRPGTRFPLIVFSSNRRVVMGSLNLRRDYRLEFSELRHSEDSRRSLTLWPLATILLLPPGRELGFHARILEATVLWRRENRLHGRMAMKWIGGEDVAYSVGIARALQPRETRVIVWLQNFANGTEFTSQLHRWGRRPETFPLGQNLRSFKPTSRAVNFYNCDFQPDIS